MIVSTPLLVIVGLAILIWLLFDVIPLDARLRNILAIIVAIVIVWLVLGMLGLL